MYEILCSLYKLPCQERGKSEHTIPAREKDAAAFPKEIKGEKLIVNHQNGKS
jgi:hypothetical protein